MVSRIRSRSPRLSDGESDAEAERNQIEPTPKRMPRPGAHGQRPRPSSSVVTIEDTDDNSDAEHVADLRWPTQPRLNAMTCYFLLELFSPPRVAPVFENQYGGTGVSMDKTNGWDANEFGDVANMWQWLTSTMVEAVILSPPCTMFSTLMGWNRRRMPAHVWQRRISEALRFWHLACDVATFQHQRGLGFVIEHPVGASSWSDSYVEGI